MTSGFDFSAKQLLEQPTTLYLRFNEAELDSSKHILRLTVLALITAILRYKDANPDTKTQPVLLGLDEAGRVHIPRLEDLVSTVAGRGVSALVYVQDLSQFEATYGAANAKTIRSNCHTQLFYPPKDLETAKYISNACGFTTRPTRSYSKERGVLETRRYTYSESKRELITPDEVRQLSPETVILLAGDKPPIKAKRLTWFKTPWLKRHTQLAPTDVSLNASVVHPVIESPLGEPSNKTGFKRA
jgi:type IV secretion system protein VirD4